MIDAYLPEMAECGASSRSEQVLAMPRDRLVAARKKSMSPFGQQISVGWKPSRASSRCLTRIYGDDLVARISSADECAGIFIRQSENPTAKTLSEILCLVGGD